ncbi:MAG: prepilin-type N-terminal cleavage/methylation domain-containing protein [Phycisphaerales bacterium]|nr:prepilin-type N-terminal cleavage/methylation domain-containing protein [Phycisphaerales bacterium]
MHRGFSLIELVITMSILGIIATMAMPRYSDASDGYKLQSSEKQILATLDAWRQRARTSAKYHTIYFDIANDTIYLFDGEPRSVNLATDRLNLGSAPFVVDLRKTDLENPVNQL